MIYDEAWQVMRLYNLIMRFRDDSIKDFIDFKINNPHGLSAEIQLMEDRKECARKLEEFEAQMESMKAEEQRGKEQLEVAVAKRVYLSSNYEEEKAALEEELMVCKARIDACQQECKLRQTNNAQYLTNFEEFLRDMAVQKEETMEKHTQQLTFLSDQTTQLQRQIQEKRERRDELEERVKQLKDRRKILNNTSENMEGLKARWQTKQSELAQAREAYADKERQLREQINHNNSMEKVIYGNFYKRCSQLVGDMKGKLSKLYDTSISEEGNAEIAFDTFLGQLKSRRSELDNFLRDKREKFKVGAGLGQVESQVYNNIVETKIDEQMISRIDESQFVTTDTMIEELEKGLEGMMKRMTEERELQSKKKSSKDDEITELNRKIVEFALQIDEKKQQVLSPMKKSKKK